MFARDDSPWCTRAEAAGYLSYEDAESVDSKLTDSEKPVSGKIRFRKIIEGNRHRVRLWREDVLKLLPPFED